MIDFAAKIFRKIMSVLLRQNSAELSERKSIYTKDFLTDNNFIVGDYTYGKPKVLFPNPNANLTIGKFCCIAENVTIFLGGNHRTNWITTYPFNTLWRNSFDDQKVDGYSATKGSVIIGHDVWLGYNSTILSGITIGNGGHRCRICRH